mgnify:CR=1 FL=1
MRINLTKKDLVNRIYMQIGFSKEITENLVDEFFSLIVLNLKKEKQLKISNFGTFSIRFKKSRIGRNPKTKEEFKIAAARKLAFKVSNKVKSILN